MPRIFQTTIKYLLLEKNDYLAVIGKKNIFVFYDYRFFNFNSFKQENQLSFDDIIGNMMKFEKMNLNGNEIRNKLCVIILKA